MSRRDCGHGGIENLLTNVRFFLLSAFSVSSVAVVRQSQNSGMLPPRPIWPIRPHLITAMPRGSRGQMTSWPTSRSKTKRSSILAQRPHSFFETATRGWAVGYKRYYRTKMKIQDLWPFFGRSCCSARNGQKRKCAARAPWVPKRSAATTVLKHIGCPRRTTGCMVRLGCRRCLNTSRRRRGLCLLAPSSAIRVLI